MRRSRTMHPLCRGYRRSAVTRAPPCTPRRRTPSRRTDTMSMPALKILVRLFVSYLLFSFSSLKFYLMLHSYILSNDDDSKFNKSLRNDLLPFYPGTYKQNMIIFAINRTFLFTSYEQHGNSYWAPHDLTHSH